VWCSATWNVEKTRLQKGVGYQAFLQAGGYPPLVTMADGSRKELLVGYDLEILEGKGYVEVHKIRSNLLKREKP